jgi:AmiR/NasT family two-component response regulator
MQRTFPGSPVIALLGTETPTRLKLVFDLDPASFLVKPLRSGIYAALVMAFERSERTNQIEATDLEAGRAPARKARRVGRCPAGDAFAHRR